MGLRTYGLLLAGIVAGCAGPCVRAQPFFPRAKVSNAVSIQKKESTPAHPLSVITLETAVSHFIANRLPHPDNARGPLRLDMRHIAYGDLNGDGNEDAVVILVDATGAPRWIVAAINRDGAASITDPHVVGDRTVIQSIEVRSGKLLLGISPAGTAQRQRVEFTFVEKDDQGQPGLILSFPAAPGEQSSSTWLSYESTSNGVSFRYPRDYFLQEMVGDVFLNGNPDRPYIDFSIVPVTNFVSDAVNQFMKSCGADGPDGGSNCEKSDVKTYPISFGGFPGYRILARVRDVRTRKFTGETVGPIYYFLLSPSAMLEVYSYKNRSLPAILRTLSRPDPLR